MSRADQDKWDRRYAEGAYADRTHPSALLREWIDRLPKGRALDLACGAGRNSLFLAHNGFDVTAMDISCEGLERARNAARHQGLEISFLQVDLDAGLPSLGGFDVVCLFRYVDRELIRALPSILTPTGVLLVEEHLATDQLVAGPSNPRFRVRPGSLRRWLPGLSVLLYQEETLKDPHGREVALARFVGAKR